MTTKVAKMLILDEKDTARLEAGLAIYAAAMALALEDLETWHNEAMCYHDRDGGLGYARCCGCDTCERTIPLLKSALEMANRDNLPAERLLEEAIRIGGDSVKDLAEKLLQA